MEDAGLSSVSEIVNGTTADGSTVAISQDGNSLVFSLISTGMLYQFQVRGQAIEETAPGQPSSSSIQASSNHGDKLYTVTAMKDSSGNVTASSTEVQPTSTPAAAAGGGGGGAIGLYGLFGMALLMFGFRRKVK